ncbi:MAG: serine/threonine protein phosphatase [Pedosphaera sp.]|nr:serine/threonine protein phosphatase [Pedosphaera sp.]
MKVRMTSFGLPHHDGCESHDAFEVKSWDETVIAVLADGAGSSVNAREAAQRAVRSFVNHYQTRPRTWTPQKALSEFTRVINRTLHQDSISRFGAPELVTTLSVAVIEGDRLYGLNVGDSRVYLVHDGAVTQLSRDHVAERTGMPHVLDRALGLEADIEPHSFEHDLKDGDLAMLCSDGIFNSLKPEELADTLRRRSSARVIVASAREQATPETRDDASAIVLDVETTGKLAAVKESPLRIPGKLKAGDVVDGFTLIRSFQHSDRTWLATREGSRFVLKFAPIEARENEDILNLFIKESWNAERLNEGNFFPRSFIPGNATARFYAMEFIEAPSLKSFLRSRRLAVDEAIALGKYLLDAEQYLLRFDLVHGDIKPENILVVQGYDRIQFKLIDFGSVTEIFSVTSRAGTASYLAPERFHEAPISERTELFAVGVTLYEALTHALPHGEIERFQTPRFHNPKHPGKLNANLPSWLESVVLRSLSLQVRSRYQHYSEMLFDLSNPERVVPLHSRNEPLLARDPLLFYKTGFFILLAAALALLIILLKK